MNAGEGRDHRRLALFSPSGVLLVALVGFGLRLWLALTTYGTDDVSSWHEFTRGALDHGPVDIYGVTFKLNLYNHGPLTSWLLVGIGRLADAGVSFPFLVRLPSCLADLLSAWLVFDLARRLHGERAAALASFTFSLTPIAIIVSGFHGNTDPVFVCLTMLSCWCLVVRGSGTSAGLALGLAISVKVVPIVMLPLLVVIAWRLGRGVVARFVAGGGAVFVALWVPVLLRQPSGFLHHVLGYSGSSAQWGIPQAFSFLLGLNDRQVFQAGQHLKLVVVTVVAVLPAVLAWRSPGEPVRLLRYLGLPCCLMLVLSTAFGMQYLVWPLAMVLVSVPLRLALPYAVSASVFGLLVYCGWGGLPWHWDHSHFTPLPDIVVPLELVAWGCLLRIAAVQCLGEGRRSTAPPPPRPPGEAQQADRGHSHPVAVRLNGSQPVR